MTTNLLNIENKGETPQGFYPYISKEEKNSGLGKNKFENIFDSKNTPTNRTLVLIIGLIIFFLSLSNIFAQTNIARYSFSNSTGNSYTPITGGTVVTSGSYDNTVSAAVTMGGTFNYGGTNFTTCFISSNGYVTFGAAAAGINYTPLSTLGSTTGAISAFGQDGAGSTAIGATPEIRYQNTGTEFVVQFKDHSNYYNRTTERLNFQIRLTYASGQIDIIYGTCTAPGTSSTFGTSVQVGIRGNSVNYTNNVNNLYLKNVPTGTTCNWTDAVAGFSNTSDITFSGTTNVNMAIPSGLKYTWVNQTAVAPVRTIAVPASITSNGATISWTAATGATKYDIQYRVVGTCSWTNWTGNPVSGTSVSLTGLLPTTKYQVRIKSSNATVGTYYSHIPGTTANSDGYATTGTFTTIASCSGPSSLASLVTSNSSATISWVASASAPASGYQYYYSNTSTAPISSTTPSGSVGAGVTTASITGLTPNTTYYVWVRSNCGGSVSSSWVGSISFVTTLVVPSSGNNSYTLCSGTIYDHAGPTTAYSNSISGYTVLYPATAGSYLQVSGTSAGETCCDFINIYSGVGTTGTLLWSGYAGIGTIPTTVSNAANGALTIQFSSDFSIAGAGFEINVSCVAPCSGTPSAGNATAAISSFCATGSTTVSLTGNTSGSGISYQWQNSLNGSTWNDITGATSTTFTTPTLLATTQYRCKVICSGSGITSNSSVAIVTITPSPVAFVTPSSDVHICSPSTTVQLGISSASNLTAYQWSLNGTAISGATSSTYTASSAGNYSVVVSSGACSNTVNALVSLNNSPTVSASLNPSTICEGEALNFSTSATVSDTNYTVNAVAYSRLQASGTSTILASTGVNNSSSNFTGNLDDGYWSGIALPFNFNFYGANYSDLTISTNGNVQFGNSLSTTWVISPAPTAGVPDNYIGAPWVDIDFSSTINGSKVEYFTNGTAPNRQFVINWYAPLYGSSDKDTCQLVLTEGSNSILVNLAAFVNTTHKKTLGVENSNGTVATVAPGRNGTYWQTTTNESWLFTKTNLNYAWSGPSSFSSNNQNPVISNATVANSGNYTVTVTNASGCSGSAAVTASVGKAPVLTCPSNISVNAANGSCSAIVNFAATALGSPAPTISYSVNSGSSFNVGTTTVTVIATNSCGADTCSFVVTVLPGTTNYWVGGISTDWFNANNWCAGVPTASTDVQLSAGAVNMPVINTVGAVCKNIVIGANASLSMTSNSNLTVYGNWSLNGSFTSTGGNVTFNGTTTQLLSGATTYNDLVVNNVNGITINNNVTINGLAQLVNGNITTGSNIVIISNGGSLSAQAGHINGYLRKTINAGTAVMENFEVGNGVNATHVSLIFNNVTTAGTLTVNSVNGDNASIQTSGFDPNKTINRNWNMVNAGIGFDYYDMNVAYAQTDKDINFLATYASTKIFAGGVWNDVNTSFVGNNSVSIDQATIIGSVQVGMFNPVPEIFTVTPDYGYVGANATVSIEGRGFINGVTSVNPMAGITINSTTITSDTTMTLSLSISASATIGARSIILTNAAPMGGSSDPAAFTVRTLPVANFYSNSTVISCNTNTTVQFNNYSTDGASYSWNFGAGAVPATATGFGPHTVSYTTTGLKTVSMIAFSPIGNDTLVRTNFINVSANAPATPASITGATSICSYGTSNLTYSIPLVAGVTGYTWTIPAGVNVVSGQGTRILVVNFSSTFSTGVLSVTQSNPCGTSVAKSITINRAPAVPTAITGSTMVCGLTSATYTATAVSGATGYIWTLPAGITSAAGASPVTTATNTISVTIASTFTTGVISVQASNACSTSAAKSLTVSNAAPTPGTITGSAMVCGLTTATYSIAAVTGATGYTWTLPAGVTSVSGASPISTSSTSITVTFASSFMSGAITVKATNACASSAARSLTISRAPATPGVITGPTAICTLTSASYSVAAVTGATSYLWTLPVGVTTTTGASTLTTSLPTISVVITTAFVSGNITVKASNACASSAVRTLVLGTCLRSAVLESNSDEVQTVNVLTTLYPNPSNGEFNINYVSAISSDLQLEVYDAQGRKVFEKNEQIVEGENILNYTSILENKGIYFVKLIDSKNNFMETKTLVVQ